MPPSAVSDLLGALQLSFGAPLVLAALIALPLLWWLLRVTPPLPRRTVFPPLRLLRGLGLRERLVGSLRLGLQRFEHLQRELQIALLALELIDLLALDRERIEEDPDLGLLRVRDASQLLDVLLAIEIDHASIEITPQDPKQEVFVRSRSATAIDGRAACILR